MKLIPGLALLWAAGALLPAETALQQALDLSPRVGLRFAYVDTACREGAERQDNNLRVALALARLGIEPLENLSVNLQFGYNLAYAAAAVDFSAPPLRIERDKFQGLAFGAGVNVGPFVSGDFELLGALDVLLLHEGRRGRASPLQPDATEADGRFHLLSADGLLRYQALTGVVPYAGLRLSLLGGRFRARGSPAAPAEEQAVSFRQRRIVGVVAGVAVEVGANWEVTVEASLVNRTALALTFDYAF